MKKFWRATDLRSTAPVAGATLILLGAGLVILSFSFDGFIGGWLLGAGAGLIVTPPLAWLHLRRLRRNTDQADWLPSRDGAPSGQRDD